MPQASSNPGLRLPIIQSPTRVELEQRCHRRHLLSDLLLREAYKSPSAAFGTVIHAGTNEWWQALEVEKKSGAEAYERMIDVALTDYPEFLGQGKDYHTQELTRKILHRYSQDAVISAGSPRGAWEILDMERRFTYKTAVSTMTFKLDRVLANLKEGTLLIADTKTSSRPDAKWAKGMTRSVQQRIYNYLAQQVYKMPVAEHWIEGIDKKGSVGAIHYEQIDALWTPAYVDEAFALAQKSAENDEASIVAAYSSSKIVLTDEGLVPDDVEEERLDQALLGYASTKAPFNEQDCYSYYVECPYRGVCDADPGDRVALLNDESNFTRGEPWQAEVEL